nr:Putative uncharacterized protein [Moritella viscosa]SHO04946.1 Putative uncharacterized protein [Moritella viscosa]SHO08000.1 Putative uncharacterized protein [Moritella viscosa]SHO11658.1 Putative uncharacterized protein [Moritella viscosa]
MKHDGLMTVHKLLQINTLPISMQYKLIVKKAHHNGMGSM